jgi:hypothetical protein
VQTFSFAVQFGLSELGNENSYDSKLKFFPQITYVGPSVFNLAMERNFVDIFEKCNVGRILLKQDVVSQKKIIIVHLCNFQQQLN